MKQLLLASALLIILFAPTVADAAPIVASPDHERAEMRVAPVKPEPDSGSEYIPPGSGNLASDRGTLIENLDTSETFDSIQDAIDDSDTVDGHVLQFMSGVTSHALTAQVVVYKAVSIIGVSGGTTTLHPGADVFSVNGSAGSMILVDETVGGNGRGAHFEDLIIDGDYPTYEVYSGIRMQPDLSGAAATTIEDCTIKNIRKDAYYGFGIIGYSSTEVTDCVLENIGRVGIWGGNGPTTATTLVVTGTTYTGKGAGDHLDYAIEVELGGTGTLSGNTLSDCRGVAYDGSVSGGILATTYFDVGTNVTLTASTIGDNSYGVVVGYDASDVTELTASGNDLSGNDENALDSTSNEQVDATGNWWGDLDPSDDVAGDVDYSPWWGTNYVGDDHSSAWTWYTNDSIQEAIDDAGAGDLVNVLAGTYREQLYIDHALDLQGAGIGSSIIEAVDLGDRTTYSITQWTGSPRTIDACVGVDGAGTVNIDGFTVDGRELGPDDFYGIHFFDTSGSITNCRIEDVIYSAAPGAQNVASVVTTHGEFGSFAIDISDNVVPNFQKGGLVVMGPEATCIVDDNDIDNAPSPHNAGNGIQISYGASGSADGNEVTGVGYTGEDWAATGILLFESDDVSVSGGLVDQCQMGVNFSQWNWIYTPTATPALDFSGVELDQCDWSIGIHLGDDGANLDIDVTDCYIHDGTYSGVDLYGSDGDPWGGGYYGGWTNGTLNAAITDNIISTGDGIVEWVELAGNTVNITAQGNDLSGCGDYGAYNNYTNTLDAEDCWWGDPAGPTLVPSPLGAGASPARPAPYLASDDEFPRTAPLAPRLSDGGGGGRGGVNVSAGVDFDPWKAGNIVCVPDPQEISSADADLRDEVVLRYLGGASGWLYGYSLDVQWDATKATLHSCTRPSSGPFSTAVAFQVVILDTDHIRVDAALGGAHPGTPGQEDLCEITFEGAGCGETALTLTINNLRDNDNNPLTGGHADNGLLKVDLEDPTVSAAALVRTNLPETGYAKDHDNLELTATIGDACGDLADLTVTADLSDLLESGGTAVAPTSYDTGTGLATWVLSDVDLTTPDEAKNVTITAVDLLGNSGTGGASTYADNTKPGTISDFASEPGHNKCELSWTNPAGDPDLDNCGIMLRRTDWDGSSPPGQDDYPEYTGSAPSYPDSADGTQIYRQPGMVADYTDTFAGDGSQRDIYYYQAFVFDKAYNYGLGDPAARDRATNYWLGDVRPAGYDGYVSTADISALGATYYETPGGGTWDNECDVGPTDDGSGTGIPLPDDQVQFEDLMIFALNFGVVTPLWQPTYGVPDVPTTGDVALRLDVPEEIAVGGEFSASVLLKDDAGIVQGTHFVVAFDPTVLEYLGAGRGELLSHSEHFFFMPKLVDGEADLSIAALGQGATFGSSGELAELRFRVTGEGTIALRLEDVQARDTVNEDLLIPTADVISGPQATTPTHVYLRGNQPNPFTGGTTIAFGLPEAGRARLAIYDVSGRMVRTLVDGTLPAAEHAVSWDRRDDSGHAVSNGIYLYRLETDQKTITRKMIVSN